MHTLADFIHTHTHTITHIIDTDKHVTHTHSRIIHTRTSTYTHIINTHKLTYTHIMHPHIYIHNVVQYTHKHTSVVPQLNMHAHYTQTHTLKMSMSSLYEIEIQTWFQE